MGLSCSHEISKYIGGKVNLIESAVGSTLF